MVKSHRSSLFHQWPERFSAHLHLDRHHLIHRDREKNREDEYHAILSPSDSPTRSDPFGSQVTSPETIHILSPPHSRPASVVSPTFSSYSYSGASSTGSAFSTRPSSLADHAPSIASKSGSLEGAGKRSTTPLVSGSATTPKIVLASPSTSTIHYLFLNSDNRSNPLDASTMPHFNEHSRLTPSSAKHLSRSVSTRTNSPSSTEMTRSNSSKKSLYHPHHSKSQVLGSSDKSLASIDSGLPLPQIGKPAKPMESVTKSGERSSGRSPGSTERVMSRSKSCKSTNLSPTRSLRTVRRQDQRSGTSSPQQKLAGHSGVEPGMSDRVNWQKPNAIPQSKTTPPIEKSSSPRALPGAVKSSGYDHRAGKVSEISPVRDHRRRSQSLHHHPSPLAAESDSAINTPAMTHSETRPTSPETSNAGSPKLPDPDFGDPLSVSVVIASPSYSHLDYSIAGASPMSQSPIYPVSAAMARGDTRRGLGSCDSGKIKAREDAAKRYQAKQHARTKSRPSTDFGMKESGSLKSIRRSMSLKKDKNDGPRRRSQSLSAKSIKDLFIHEPLPLPVSPLLRKEDIRDALVNEDERFGRNLMIDFGDRYNPINISPRAESSKSKSDNSSECHDTSTDSSPLLPQPQFGKPLHPAFNSSSSSEVSVQTPRQISGSTCPSPVELFSDTSRTSSPALRLDGKSNVKLPKRSDSLKIHHRSRSRKLATGTVHFDKKQRRMVQPVLDGQPKLSPSNFNHHETTSNHQGEIQLYSRLSQTGLTGGCVDNEGVRPAISRASSNEVVAHQEVGPVGVNSAQYEEGTGNEVPTASPRMEDSGAFIANSICHTSYANNHSPIPQTTPPTPTLEIYNATKVSSLSMLRPQAIPASPTKDSPIVPPKAHSSSPKLRAKRSTTFLSASASFRNVFRTNIARSLTQVFDSRTLGKVTSSAVNLNSKRPPKSAAEIARRNELKSIISHPIGNEIEFSDQRNLERKWREGMLEDVLTAAMGLGFTESTNGTKGQCSRQVEAVIVENPGSPRDLLPSPIIEESPNFASAGLIPEDDFTYPRPPFANYRPGQVCLLPSIELDERCSIEKVSHPIAHQDSSGSISVYSNPGSSFPDARQEGTPLNTEVAGTRQYDKDNKMKRRISFSRLKSISRTNLRPVSTVDRTVIGAPLPLILGQAGEKTASEVSPIVEDLNPSVITDECRIDSTGEKSKIIPGDNLRENLSIDQGNRHMQSSTPESYSYYATPPTGPRRSRSTLSLSLSIPRSLRAFPSRSKPKYQRLDLPPPVSSESVFRNRPLLEELSERERQLVEQSTTNTGPGMATDDSREQQNVSDTSNKHRKVLAWRKDVEGNGELARFEERLKEFVEEEKEILRVISRSSTRKEDRSRITES